MPKAELMVPVAERPGLTKSQARAAVDAVLGTVAETVRRGEAVRLVGFGNFESVSRAAGMARNPKTGAPVQRPASRSIKFRPGDALRGSMQ